MHCCSIHEKYVETCLEKKKKLDVEKGGRNCTSNALYPCNLVLFLWSIRNERVGAKRKKKKCVLTCHLMWEKATTKQKVETAVIMSRQVFNL